MVYVLLAPGFEEAEALVPVDLLRRANVETATVSLTGEPVPGSHGITVTADLAMDQVDLDRAEMIVLPGGGVGVKNLGADPRVEELVREAVRRDIWVAAICAAPTLLARAGLLPQGVPCVCYPGMEGELERAGARPQMDKSVVVHNRLVTSQAPGTAFDFALTLAELLAGIPAACRLHSDLHYGA